MFSPVSGSQPPNLLDSTLPPGVPHSSQWPLLEPPMEPLKPPPRVPQGAPLVPPRPSRQKETFLLDSNNSLPRLPPRNHGNTPPPVPPRKDSIPGTLPRAHSVSVPNRLVPSNSATLPRRNSERDAPHTPVLNVNGESCAVPELPPKTANCIPELPPKTYKSQHSRKQSS